MVLFREMVRGMEGTGVGVGITSWVLLAHITGNSYSCPRKSIPYFRQLKIFNRVLGH